MQARVFRPSKSAMQSGRGKAQEWVLECERDAPRRPDPLMGWTSAGDTYNQIRLTFPTMQQALDFARLRGWEVTVDVAHERRVRPRNYVDNFKYRPPETSGATGGR